MRTAERQSVSRNAEFHRGLAAHFRERAGVKDEPEEQTTEGQSAEGQESESNNNSRRRSLRRADQQTTEPSEKPEFMVISEMHAEAARQLEDLVVAASTGPAIAQERAELPDDLRRANVPVPRDERPTGVRRVRSGPPAR